MDVSCYHAGILWAYLIRYLRPLGSRYIYVLKSHMVYLVRFLKITDAWFPEDVMYIHIGNSHITKSVMLRCIPEDTFDSCTVYAEIPSGSTEDLLIVILLKYGRNDICQQLCFRFIVSLSRQDVRLWETVHDVSMFVQQRVDRPCGADIYTCLLSFVSLSTDHRPMPESPPLLILRSFYVDHLLAFDISLEILKSFLGLLLSEHPVLVKCEIGYSVFFHALTPFMNSLSSCKYLCIHSLHPSSD